MSCRDCFQPAREMPQPVPEPTFTSPRGTGWVVYTGGTHQRHLAMMRHTLSPGYDRVTFHDDGSIEYRKGPDDWEPPSPIEGYERDPKNPLFFRPLWKSCTWRMYGTEVMAACQCLQVLLLLVTQSSESRVAIAIQGITADWRDDLGVQNRCSRRLLLKGPV